MKLLGVTGQAGAGKDHLFHVLSGDSRCGKVERVALADTLRFELDALLGLPRGNSAFWHKPYPPEIRAILQWYGTEYRRGQDPEYWVNQTERYIWSLEDTDIDLVVVTDVRYDNEAEMIRRNGGVVVEMVASPEVRAERLGLTVEQVRAQSRHASEVIDFETDYRVENDSNGGDLRLPSDLYLYLRFR